MGHSGTTGYDSVPGSPETDEQANSWATGTNPAVDSVYQRILAAHPGSKGHAASFGIDGSAVGSLLLQEERAAKVKPAPGLVLIQSIDNDIKCDGSDAKNYAPFEATLTKVLDALTHDLPGADIFFVDQWANVKSYDRVAVTVDKTHLEGTGPCDVVDAATHQLDPARERYLQGLVDDYFAIIVKVCAKYPKCRTDGGALQKMPLEKQDLTPDLDHLSVQGHHQMAELAYAALSD